MTDYITILITLSIFPFIVGTLLTILFFLTTKYSLRYFRERKTPMLKMERLYQKHLKKQRKYNSNLDVNSVINSSDLFAIPVYNDDESIKLPYVDSDILQFNQEQKNLLNRQKGLLIDKNKLRQSLKIINN